MITVQKILYGILATIVLVVFSYLVGFQKGQKNCRASADAASVKELNKTIKETNDKIKSFNEQQRIDFESAIKASDERQKISQNSVATKEDLKQFFAQNNQLYTNCVLPKEQLEKLNKSIGQ